MESSQVDLSKDTKIGCPRKSYLSRMSSVTTDSDSLNPSGLDILANIASPKHQRVDSFSNVSLPDEMRISFSESDVSFQLDDVDFSYSPSTDVDLSNANIVSIETNSELNGDKDLQSIQASITSTSGTEINRNNDIIQRPWIGIEENGKKRKKNSSKQLLNIGEPIRENNELQEKGPGDRGWNRDSQEHQVSTVGSSGEVIDKKLTSPRRGNKVKHQMNVACQVCGDLAAGFYCGAYICEACKKFYMRAYKLDKMKYVCLRDKKCQITKESRVQCQFCRYQKCLSLNMYFPKQGEDNHKEAAMSEIPCRVCSAPSSGFHFGAITCEGCKGFFRRMVKERDCDRYQCSKQGDCEINMLTRNLCKACRYEKCLKAGMNIEASRIGRQPNSVKHMISIELKNKMKPDPDGDKVLNVGINQNGLEIEIKKEPVDSPEAGLDHCGINSRLNDETNQPVIQNSWNNICNNVPSTNSASSQQQQSAQISFPSDLNTSPNQNKNYTYLGIETHQNSAVNQTSGSGLSSFVPSTSQTNQFNRNVIGSNLQPNNQRTGQATQPLRTPGIMMPIPEKIPRSQKSFDNLTKGLPLNPKSVSVQEKKLPSWNRGGDMSSSNSDFNLDIFEEDGSNVIGTVNIVKDFDLLSDSDEAPDETQPSPVLWNQSQGMGQIQQHQQKQQQQQQQQEQQLRQQQHQHSITYPGPGQQGLLADRDYGPSQPKKSRSPTPEMVDNFGERFDFKPRPSFFGQMGGNGGGGDEEDVDKNHLNMSMPEFLQNVFEAGKCLQLLNYRGSKRPSFFGQMGGDGGGGDEEDVDKNHLNMSMPEFLQNVFEAGKCLQLLNYRVFDTDLNPTASMNVDEIKNLFKSKNVDPREGNQITCSVNMSMFATKESTWSYMMTNFHHNTYITIRFAKMVPGFKSLSLNDQVKLIQTSIYPIELLNMSKVYDPVTKWYNYFTYTKPEENIMMEHFPMLRVLQEHFLHVGEMVSTFSLTDEEFALLSALLLFPAEISGLENPKAVEDLQNTVTAALQYYEEQRSPDGLTRFGILLVRVAELIQCLLQHNLAIGLLLTRNPTIKVPQLFHELIIESIKEGQRS